MLKAIRVLRRLDCYIHDYDYFAMTRLDGTPEYYRCCLVCEHTDEIDEAAFREGYEATYIWPPLEESTPCQSG